MTRGRRRGGRAQPYDRNKFLQANFRFLVSDSVDLRRHAGDADLMLDWDDVLQVDILNPPPPPFKLILTLMLGLCGIRRLGE